MKFFKFVILVGVAAVCNTQSGARKFAVELCNTLSQENRALFQGLLVMSQQLDNLQLQIATNANLSPKERADLERQASSLRYLMEDKAEMRGKEGHDLMLSLYSKIREYNNQHTLRVISVLVNELTRRQNS